ncbi:MAG TPA: pitrilysin family protein [Terriglobia bacterium]|nr:pitrilysin family protein [Terriglobia bacterium]
MTFKCRRAPVGRTLLAGALLVLGVAWAPAQDVKSFEKRVTVKVLDNGLTVVICERHEAPVFSFFTHVDVGSDREYPGITGLAHMFEHMAFKGTDKIGTTDYAKEKVALAKVEETYAAYDRERRQEFGSDPKKLAELEKAWKDAMDAAEKYVVPHAFDQIVEDNGGVGMNAFTDDEETGYVYSFPSNRVELWAYLESERFLHPVMREFYKERDVVFEERRMRTDSNPNGRLFEQFLGTAFIAHPYGRPTVGWPSDLESFSATDAQHFFDKYYVAPNIVIGIVGDVKASEVVPIVEKYFGRLPKRPKPEPLATVEPPQRSEREVILHERAQPLYIEGYHKPSALDLKNEQIFDALQDLMSNGRTSRLYRSLVRDKKIAAFAGGFNDFPGAKYPDLFVFFAVPTPGHTPEELRDAIHAEIDRLKREDISDDELTMIKTRVKADLLRSLDSNLGLAQQFALGQALVGDWRYYFEEADRIGQVSKADIRGVANQTFVDSNRDVGIIESTAMAGSKGKGAQQ